MFIWIVIMGLAVFFDQLSKYLTVLLIKPEGTVPIIEDVVHLTYVENTGAAFGMMKDMRWLFMVVSSVAIIALLIYMFKKKSQSRLENWAIALIIGGGIGNMIDRICLGYVVDMIDFRLINFAVFNVADTFVCIGAGLLMLHIILLGVQEYKEEKAKKLAMANGTASEDEEVAWEEAAQDSESTSEDATVWEEATQDSESTSEDAPADVPVDPVSDDQEEAEDQDHE